MPNGAIRDVEERRVMVAKVREDDGEVKQGRSGSGGDERDPQIRHGAGAWYAGNERAWLATVLWAGGRECASEG